MFHSVFDLQAGINRYLAEHNGDPKPVVLPRYVRERLTGLRSGEDVLAWFRPQGEAAHQPGFARAARGPGKREQVTQRVTRRLRVAVPRRIGTRLPLQMSG